MPRPSSILVAVTPEELRDFLPEPILSEVRRLTPAFQHLDTTDLAVDRFHHALAAANPEVLVGCWKTPKLSGTLPPGLRYVGYLCGSVRQLVPRGHVECGLLVTNWGGSISRVVAECALFHILCGLRHATHWIHTMHGAGGWRGDDPVPASLFGRRVGLHGFGHVARELVGLLRPFGCNVSIFAPDIDATAEASYRVRRATTLESLFSGNDIIVELAPLIPETTGIVGEKLLRLIRPGGVFVNVGRGSVVDETALLVVAREGQIMIGLDVFTVEPLPADSPFRGLRNVTLTPHIAGPTHDRLCDAGEFLLRNLRAYRDGLPLQALITSGNYDLTA